MSPTQANFLKWAATLAFAALLCPSPPGGGAMAFCAPRRPSGLRVGGNRSGGIVGGAGGGGGILGIGGGGGRPSSSSSSSSSRTKAKNGDSSGGDFVDPNPGGLNQWDDDDDDDDRRWEDLSFPEQVREWFTSTEGQEDVRTYRQPRRRPPAAVAHRRTAVHTEFVHVPDLRGGGSTRGGEGHQEDPSVQQEGGGGIQSSLEVPRYRGGWIVEGEGGVDQEDSGDRGEGGG